ncbi:coiled-coil domain-containing protein 103 [Malurus melanocephalus]|uniref:coiled-coil domain-containing protein 103 n=1 Tax=Malurus melanocephalus TaxID=175006 RepID=UPI002548D530|nr:coiled-coil domain-containing protein 103 [Malurus melanocephalus]
MDPAGALPALERELRAALAEDERRQREGEAKLRALRQGVPDYGQFREIVLASHLKPLDKKDRLGQRRNVLWNPCAAPAEASPAHTVEIPQELDQLPGTAAEFHRDWRRCLKSGTEKYRFLLELGGEALGRIFQADVGFGLLGEFLTVLAENIHPGDRAAVLQILQSLAGTKRFGLNVALLSQGEKESNQDLFRKLQNCDCQAAGQPGSPASCETGREAHPVDTHLEKEIKEERTVVELMKCYQVS